MTQTPPAETPSAPAANRTIVFDIGGVLVPEGQRRARLRERLSDRVGDYDQDAFTQAYWEGRNDYDQGASAVKYWQPVLEQAGIDPSRITLELIDYLARVDGELAAEISVEMLDVICRLKREGDKLYILSNAPAAMAQAVRDQSWFNLFDGAIFSSEVGLIKPEPSIYQKVEEIAGPDLYFFDDRSINVEAAAACGWKASEFPGADALLSALETISTPQTQRKEDSSHV